MTQDPAILRFNAFLERVEQRSVLTMPRATWDTIWPTSGSVVQINVEQTPMVQVARSASLIAALAVQYAPSNTQIHIYRYDDKDQPTPVNLDKYAVWTDLSRHPAYQSVVAAASAQDSPALSQYLHENVFMVKMDKGPDHWLEALPGSAAAVIKPIE